MLANLCVAVGLMLRLFADRLPDFLTIILSNILVLTGTGLFYIALSQFTGFSYSKAFVIGVIAIVLSWLLGNPVRIQPLAVSKANTVAQIVLAGTVLADEGFGLGLGWARFVLIWLTGALTVASLAAYLRSWLLHMSGNESPEAHR